MSASYSELREKNLREQSLKLKELGVNRAEETEEPSKKRRRQTSGSDDDNESPKKRQVAQRGPRRSRKPVSYYQSDPNDADFDADDPGLAEESDDSEKSENSSKSKPKRRGRPSTVPTQASEVFIDVDKYLFCEDCKKYYEGDCSVHGPLIIVSDISVTADPEDDTRAKRTAPTLIRVSDTGNGVYAKKEIPARSRFGPYQGKIKYGTEAGSFCWEIKKKGKVLHCVDAKNPGVSNWMRYVNRTRNDGQQNLNAFQYGGRIFYRSTRTIKPSEELLVWGGNAYGPLNSSVAKKSTEEPEVNRTTYKCPGCSIAYTSQDYVDRHVKTCRKLRNAESSDEVFKCTGCLCAYSSSDYLERHKKVCRKIDTPKDSGEMYKCSGCKCAYSTPDYLERHKKLCKELEAKKVPQEVFPCSGCKCAYSTVDYLNRHMKLCKLLDSKREPETMYKCTACDTAYSEQKYLDKHKSKCRQMDLTKTTESSTKHECNMCHSVYIDETFLERHKKVCEGADTKRSNGKEKPTFECTGCNRNYGNLEFLDRHKLTCAKLNPTKRTDVQCSKCPRTFADQTALNRHQRSCGRVSPSYHDALEEKEEEGRNFEEYSNDSEILKKKKPGPARRAQIEPPFVLIKRVAFFNGNSDDSEGSSSTKPYKCWDCNEGFSYPARLDAHRLNHRSQTVYVCSQCLQTFVNRRLLANHVMRHNNSD